MDHEGSNKEAFMYKLIQNTIKGLEQRRDEIKERAKEIKKAAENGSDMPEGALEEMKALKAEQDEIYRNLEGLTRQLSEILQRVLMPEYGLRNRAEFLIFLGKELGKDRG